MNRVNKIQLKKIGKVQMILIVKIKQKNKVQKSKEQIQI